MVVGLLLVPVTGWLWLDPLLAIGVALNILREGAHLALALGRRADGQGRRARVRKQIDDVLAQFAHHTIRFDHLVTRRAGQRRFVDVHMHMPANWTLGRAALRPQRRAGADERGAGAARLDPAAATDVEAHFSDPQGSGVIAVLQRVASARVEVASRVTGAIGGAC